ncbi:MAG: N-6 DNA methylase, partial [Bacteroidia bacterium]
MALAAIQNYYNEVERIIRFGGTRKETAVRTAFITLLNSYAQTKDLMLVTEVSIKVNGKIITPDGTLKDSLRQAWGYYESKDEHDDINIEIEKKFAKGYPNDNILFEDSQTAVLFQAGIEVMRITVNDDKGLDRILKEFITYQPKEVGQFRQAIELFKQDVPRVTETIKGIIQEQQISNKKFIDAQYNFIELCRESINPAITTTDVQEMMIQHILTADIFNTIFGESHFHRENNIAKELENVIETFFTGNIRRATLGVIQNYYVAINAAGAGIADHHEKQRFLKVIYETFYKSYNPKAADKLGVVYTPNEIVKFMIETTDYLLQQNFDKMLQDKGVEILDPATGTGTFICDIIDYIHPSKLAYKYQHELHANEVAILPYYIANLNIEFTYKQKMKQYLEYENLCFVDTLDNVGFSFKGKQTDIFGLSAENALRIKKQNEKQISVVIGNPPYYANQANENDNNKNREYKVIDKRIKDTFIKYSTAQKTKVYDMYARFYRWAMDRIGDDGVVTFITNRSFIDSKTFDGFRQCISNEFSLCYIVDLGGDIRKNNNNITKGNVFNIQTGV